jgi:DNA-binding transcriptional ArsR family regulator
MAFSKKDRFHSKDGDLARYASALGHPARIAILKTLAKHKACICGEIVKVMPLAQSTVSQHLKVLLEAGLIQGEIDGPKSCYCVNPKALEKLSGLFHGLLAEMPPTKGKDDGKRKSCC